MLKGTQPIERLANGGVQLLIAASPNGFLHDDREPGDEPGHLPSGDRNRAVGRRLGQLGALRLEGHGGSHLLRPTWWDVFESRLFAHTHLFRRLRNAFIDEFPGLAGE